MVKSKQPPKVDLRGPENVFALTDTERGREARSTHFKNIIGRNGYIGMIKEPYLSIYKPGLPMTTHEFYRILSDPSVFIPDFVSRNLSDWVETGFKNRVLPERGIALRSPTSNPHSHSHCIVPLTEESNCGFEGSVYVDDPVIFKMGHWKIVAHILSPLKPSRLSEYRGICKVGTTLQLKDGTPEAWRLEKVTTHGAEDPVSFGGKAIKMFEFFEVTDGKDGFWYLSPMSTATNGVYLVRAETKDEAIHLKQEIDSGRKPSPIQLPGLYSHVDNHINGRTRIYEVLE